MMGLERGEEGLAVSSGMTAIASTLSALLNAGDHLVVQQPLYSGALRFVTKYLPRLGVEVSVTNGVNAREFQAVLRPNTKAIYFESPTNPLASVTDIRSIVAVAQHAGVITIFDNTLATSINQQPLVLGVDLGGRRIIKKKSGHGDLSGGVVVGRKHFLKRVQEYVHDVGGALDPNICYLLERSLLTLSVRMERINHNALQLATFLNSHPHVSSVYYPGLPNHPGHAVARTQMSGFGGVVSFLLTDAVDPVRFQKELRLIGSSNSLGEVVTTLNSPCLASSSFMNLSASQQRASGIHPQLIRMSVGIEDSSDLIQDLDASLQNNFSH